MPLALLVVDAYAREGRAELTAAGCTEAGTLYARLARTLRPDARIDLHHPADGDGDGGAAEGIAAYDGAIWTGSSLTIHAEGEPRVARQIELARRLYRERVPSFGSCWAAQVAVVAAGGRCAKNPRGREFGISRAIRLSPEGRRHPLFRGKPDVFEAFTSHADEVTELPAGATLLASNDWSRVQAVGVERDGGTFWAVQYHPEYDPGEVAGLCRLRARELVEQGSFPDEAAALAYAARLQALHEDPTRADVAAELGLAPELLDDRARTLELGNWLEAVVEPRAS